MKVLKKIVSIIFIFCIIFSIYKPTYAAKTGKMYTTTSADVYKVDSYGGRSVIGKIEKDKEVTITDNEALLQGTYYHISSPIEGYINKNKLTSKKPGTTSSSSTSDSDNSGTTSSSDKKGTVMYVIEDVDEEKWENYSFMKTGKKYKKGDSVTVYGDKTISGKHVYILSPDIYAETYVPYDTLSKDKNDTLEKNDSIYKKPELKNDGKDSAASLDDMMSDADDFISQGEIKYSEQGLQDFSSTMFNIFSTVGAAVALIVGIVIGIKYMIGSVEEKADYKKMLVPYIAGCVAVFGAFGIWKIVITVLESI